MALVRTEHGDQQRKRIIEFIVEYRATHNDLMPQIAEIAAHVEVSRTAINFHLDELKEMGKVTFTEGQRARTLRLVTPSTRGGRRPRASH